MREQTLRAPNGAGSTETVVVASSDRAEWDDYVQRHRDATGYHRWAWRHVFENALRHRTHYLIARRGATTVGLLPLVEVSSWLFGRALSSLPYVNYGGLLVSHPAAATALMETAASLAQARRAEYIVLRHVRRQLPHLPVRSHKVTMYLDLAGTVDEMWTRLDKKVRNQIRKAEKSGLTCISGGEELLDQFYSVFARNMRDLGTPVYGRRLFAEILRQQTADARLYVVHLNDQPVACALSYSYGDTIEVPSASSLREHRALCPNHAMYWSIITDAVAKGTRRFDFGRSTPGDGTFLFKEQWGARPEPLHWEYRLIGNADLPQDDRHSPRYQARIETWKKLPLAVTTTIGPHIARLVP
jgi:FemAB-related protein (PEP-CTERM system-associated)